MYAITIGMLVRQPVMLSSIVLIKWIPGYTLFLPERDMQKSTCSNTHTLMCTQHKLTWGQSTETDSSERCGWTDLKSVSGGHSSWLHSWNSKLFPKQVRPPLAGLSTITG